MLRLSGSRLSLELVSFGIVILFLGIGNTQELFGEEVLSSETQHLLKSFQDELKTLEEAAHRVNTLLVNAAHQRTPQSQDLEAKPAENTEAVVSSDTPIDDVTADKSDSYGEDDEDEVIKEDSLLGGAIPSLNSHPINIGSLFGFFRNLPEPWWKRENVCVVKTETVKEKNNTQDIDAHVLIMGMGTFEHCKQSPAKYICTTMSSSPKSTKTVSTTYQCCEGFRRRADSCEQVELKSIVDTLDSLGSKDFATLFKSQDIVNSMEGQNVTIFAPSDEAMRKHDMAHQESNQISEGRRFRRELEEKSNVVSRVARQQSEENVRDMIMAHITNSLLETDDFTNEMVVKSAYRESPLRINIYPGRESAVMTVNCARLESWDNVALHTRVHTVDRVLEPATSSVLDILDQPRFSQFRQFLEQEALLEVLANLTAVTVFAPNNEAWDKLGDGLKDKYSRGEACIDKVLRHHILPLTLCSAPASEGRLTTADLDGELVRLSKQDSQLMVDDKGRVVRPDIVATNGVIHELDKVLTPKSAKPLSDLLLMSNHTTWLSLLDKAGLLEELNKRENITLFVPTERVLQENKTRELLEGMDRDTLRRTMLNHVTQHVPSCDMRDKAELKTEAGNSLRVTMYNPYMMFTGVEPRAAVQCVPLGHTDGKACHVVAHEVTRLLLPPNGTVLQLVSTSPQLSTLRKVMEGTQIEKDIEDKSELLEGGFTLLAPTDEAFDKLEESEFSKLLTDKKYADEVIRMHVLKEPVCCASITSMPWPLTNSARTIDNKKLEVNRDRKDRVLFGNSATETCDVITTDGVVHILDNVLLPQFSKLKLGNIAFGSPDRKIMLFGI